MVNSKRNKMNDEILTLKQEKILTEKYLQAKKDIEEGNGFTANSVEEMIEHLRNLSGETAAAGAVERCQD